MRDMLLGIALMIFACFIALFGVVMGGFLNFLIYPGLLIAGTGFAISINGYVNSKGEDKKE